MTPGPGCIAPENEQMLEILTNNANGVGFTIAPSSCVGSMHLMCDFVYDYAKQPRCEKSSFRGFRPCPTQTGLYSHRRRLEA